MLRQYQVRMLRSLPRLLAPPIQPGLRFMPRLSQPLVQRQFLTSALSPKTPTEDFQNRKVITYEELKPITEQPNDDILVIDVREPEEVIMGSIPSSVNLPLSKFTVALDMDEGEFVKTFGFKKPSKDQQIVFSCRSGKRSQNAIDLATARGYKYLRNYEGSWLDWSERSKSNS